MNRKNHLIGGFSVWIITIFILYFIERGFFNGWDNALWIVISLLCCLIGAELPDFDIIWKDVLHHRHFLTHSIILPGLLSLTVIAVSNRTNFLLPVYGLFLIGNASHLILDLFPSWKEDKDGKITDSNHVLAWLSPSLTGKKLYSALKGTYLIHFNPFKIKGKATINKTATRAWFVVNALLMVVWAVILLFFFGYWTL
ncbi:MAG: metal-dependent hydrolase [Candidatus Heimdallarchaeaceae archaeon]